MPPLKKIVHLDAGLARRAILRRGVQGEMHVCVDVSYRNKRKEKNVEFVNADNRTFLEGCEDGSLHAVHLDCPGFTIYPQFAQLVRRKLAPTGQLVVMDCEKHEVPAKLFDKVESTPQVDEINLSETLVAKMKLQGLRRKDVFKLVCTKR